MRKLQKFHLHDSRCEKQTHVRCQLYKHWSLFPACGHSTRPHAPLGLKGLRRRLFMACFRLSVSMGEKRASASEASEEKLRGFWEGGKTPSQDPLTLMNDSLERQRLLNLLSSILDLRHVFRGRTDEKERSPAAFIAGFTASSQQILWTS